MTARIHTTMPPVITHPISVGYRSVIGAFFVMGSPRRGISPLLEKSASIQ